MIVKVSKIISALVLIVAAVTVSAEKGDYYEELVSIERNMLNGNSYVEKRLKEISHQQVKFTRLEKDFYKLLQAHQDYLSSNLDSCKEIARELIKETKSIDIKAKEIFYLHPQARFR